jgi:hypothetical protein
MTHPMAQAGTQNPQIPDTDEKTPLLGTFRPLSATEKATLSTDPGPKSWFAQNSMKIMGALVIIVVVAIAIMYIATALSCGGTCPPKDTSASCVMMCAIAKVAGPVADLVKGTLDNLGLILGSIGGALGLGAIGAFAYKVRKDRLAQQSDNGKTPGNGDGKRPPGDGDGKRPPGDGDGKTPGGDNDLPSQRDSGDKPTSGDPGRTPGGGGRPGTGRRRGGRR